MATKKQLTLAIDMCGGDHGYPVTIAGVVHAARVFSECTFNLYGEEKNIEPLLRGVDATLSSRFAIVEGKPYSQSGFSHSVLREEDTCIHRALTAQRDGEVDAVVSAGDTRLLMSLSVHMLGCVSHVKRPAIAAMLPTRTGKTLLLDVGAHTERSAEVLIKNAVMGVVAGKSLIGTKMPSFALLNLGTERDKGPDELRRATAIIEHLNDLPGDFRGFTEGFVLSDGGIDVVVTDGFTGNVALKLFQGTYAWTRQKVRSALPPATHQSIDDALLLDSFNGAPLLGTKGLVIKSHGNANAAGFSAAILKAVTLAASGFTSEFEKTMDTIGVRA